MKRTLDDNLGEAFCKVADVKQDNSWMDVKLLLMFVSCVIGLVAQFYPLPFPANRALLAVCVVSYFALSALWQYMAWLIDKDYVFSSKPQKAASGSVAVDAVHLRTQMPRYDDQYTIIAECPLGSQVAKTTFSVGRVFTEKGEFSLPHLERILAEFIAPAVAALRGKKEK